MYSKIRNNRIIGIFVILTRYLIGFAFIPSGFLKIAGKRFTNAGNETEVGVFFETLYQTGLYWQFLGAVQLFAALLIMTQKLPTVGALIFLAIMSNIWVITLSMDFSGTYIITTLMMLACIMLVIWDWYRIKFLFIKNIKFTPPIFEPIKQNAIWSTAGWIIYIFSLFAFILLQYYMSFYSYAITAIAIFIFTVVIAAILINEKRQKISMVKSVNK